MVSFVAILTLKFDYSHNSAWLLVFSICTPLLIIFSWILYELVDKQTKYFVADIYPKTQKYQSKIKNCFEIVNVSVKLSQVLYFLFLNNT